MKKLFYLLALVGSSAAAYAEGTVVNTDVVTGTDGVLGTVQSYIETVASNSWTVITAIVAVGLLIWLGRAMIRAVRAYFSTSM